MSDPILRRMNARRELLMLRLDRIMEAERRGEGSTTRLELELLSDEMEFLGDLTLVLYMISVKRQFALSATPGSL